MNASTQTNIWLNTKKYIYRKHETEIFQSNAESNKPLVDSGHPLRDHQPAVCCRWVRQVSIYFPDGFQSQNMMISAFYCLFLYYRQKILGGDGDPGDPSWSDQVTQVRWPNNQIKSNGWEFGLIPPGYKITPKREGSFTGYNRNDNCRQLCCQLIIFLTFSCICICIFRL